MLKSVSDILEHNQQFAKLQAEVRKRELEKIYGNKVRRTNQSG